MKTRSQSRRASAEDDEEATCSPEHVADSGHVHAGSTSPNHSGSSQSAAPGLLRRVTRSITRLSEARAAATPYRSTTNLRRASHERQRGVAGGDAPTDLSSDDDDASTGSSSSDDDDASTGSSSSDDDDASMDLSSSSDDADESDYDHFVAFDDIREDISHLDSAQLFAALSDPDAGSDDWWAKMLGSPQAKNDDDPVVLLPRRRRIISPRASSPNHGRTLLGAEPENDALEEGEVEETPAQKDAARRRAQKRRRLNAPAPVAAPIVAPDTAAPLTDLELAAIPSAQTMHETGAHGHGHDLAAALVRLIHGGQPEPAATVAPVAHSHMFVIGGGDMDPGDFNSTSGSDTETSKSEHEDDPLSSSSSSSSSSEEDEAKPAANAPAPTFNPKTFIPRPGARLLSACRRVLHALTPHLPKPLTAHALQTCRYDRAMRQLEKSTTPPMSLEDRMQHRAQFVATITEFAARHHISKFVAAVCERVQLHMTRLDVSDQNRVKRRARRVCRRNQRIFYHILNDNSAMQNMSYFKKLAVDDQKQIIRRLRDVRAELNNSVPYHFRLLNSDLPIQLKAAAFQRMDSMHRMEPESGVYHKTKHWVDAFMKIPFQTYRDLPVRADRNSMEECVQFISEAHRVLNDSVYGLHDAKIQLMQFIGQMIANPNSIGKAIALHGPPGTGKTSLIKEGVSKILHRPFEFVALGGATDGSVLEGHGYTYEGSTWGRIAQILMNSKCMNPVIYFDELDKVSDTPHGNEIIGILTHLTDTSQNTEFHDRFFADIGLDVSRCLFIFSFNDESRVNSILRDRMHCIRTDGYSLRDKTVIARDFLLPHALDNLLFARDSIQLAPNVVEYIHEQHGRREEGVRNLKRCLETICAKINLYRMMTPATAAAMFPTERIPTAGALSFPITVTRELVDQLLPRATYEPWQSMFV